MTIPPLPDCGSSFSRNLLSRLPPLRLTPHPPLLPPPPGHTPPFHPPIPPPPDCRLTFLKNPPFRPPPLGLKLISPFLPPPPDRGSSSQETSFRASYPLIYDARFSQSMPYLDIAGDDFLGKRR